MKNITALYCLFAGAFLGSALHAQTAATEAALKKKLIGEWRNTYVKVVMHTLNNSDSTSSFQADSTNWQQVLHIKPIRTHFKSDGTYYSEYRNLNDSIVRMPKGTWGIKGDTITMVQLSPGKSSYKMHVSITNNIATFAGLIDFDGDGKDDDEYYGMQKKQGQ